MQCLVSFCTFLFYRICWSRTFKAVEYCSLVVSNSWLFPLLRLEILSFLAYTLFLLSPFLCFKELYLVMITGVSLEHWVSTSVFLISLAVSTACLSACCALTTFGIAIAPVSSCVLQIRVMLWDLESSRWCEPLNDLVASLKSRWELYRDSESCDSISGSKSHELAFLDLRTLFIMRNWGESAELQSSSFSGLILVEGLVVSSPLLSWLGASNDEFFNFFAEKLIFICGRYYWPFCDC